MAVNGPNCRSDRVRTEIDMFARAEPCRVTSPCRTWKIGSRRPKLDPERECTVQYSRGKDVDTSYCSYSEYLGMCLSITHTYPLPSSLSLPSAPFLRSGSETCSASWLEVVHIKYGIRGADKGPAIVKQKLKRIFTYQHPQLRNPLRWHCAQQSSASSHTGKESDAQVLRCALALSYPC